MPIKRKVSAVPEEIAHTCPVCKGTGSVTNEQEDTLIDTIMGFVVRQQATFADKLRERISEVMMSDEAEGDA